MKYTKPEVVRVADAIDAIQSNINKPAATVDNCGKEGTTSAYEADE